MVVGVEVGVVFDLVVVLVFVMFSVVCVLVMMVFVMRDEMLVGIGI